MSDEILQNFILAGGTALSLQIGHRISVDLDFFSKEPINVQLVNQHLGNAYSWKVQSMGKFNLMGLIKDVKLDFVTHQYDYVKPPKAEENIRLASLEDIAAMKLNAISNDGTRLKDYIDIAYLSSCLSLSKMLESYTQKYPSSNSLLGLKSLYYFDDIDHTQAIKLMGGASIKWTTIEKRLFEMRNNPNQLFSAKLILEEIKPKIKPKNT